MKTVIFDFGKVVAVFDHFQTLARLAPYTKLGPREMYDLIYDSDLEDAFERGELSADDFLCKFIELCGLTCDSATLRAAVEDIFTPNPEVIDLVPRLRPRYQVLLGSNTNVIHSTFYRRQYAHVLDQFHGLVLSHDIGVRKPKPGFFEACVKLAGCRADECVFVDDMGVNVEGAKAVGMKAILYAPGNDLEGKLCKLGIHIPQATG